MRPAEYIERIHVEGARLGEVASAVPLGAPVPGCPGWDVEALLRHIGDVHRWATAIVAERHRERLRRDFPGPADPAAVLAWYREGHAALVDTLGATPDDAVVWAWAPAPSPLAFWTRRQAHETAIHRLDVEQAAGSVTGFPARWAADGVDEWMVIAAGRCRVPGGPRRLRFTAADVPAQWTMELGDDALVARDGADPADCVVTAAAADLFAVVMNREAPAPGSVTGDPAVLDSWRQHVRF